MIERALPVIGPREIIVRNLYTTLCGSDLHTFCGMRQEKTPTILGHEIVGEVVEIGSGHSGRDYAGNPLRLGDNITWCIFSSDPQSDEAQRGMPQKASALFKYGHSQVTEQDAFHGGLGEYCVLKENTAILRIPEGIPLDVAATINCAVATVAVALRLAGDVRGKRVLITGLGLLGIVCAAMCRDQGAGRIFTADINADRLKHSLDFGADETFLLPPPVEFGDLNECPTSSSESIDIAFDMSGAPDAMELGTKALRIGGTAVWIGAVFRSRPVQVDAEQVV
jgi:alcohol dehydrogenase